MLDYLSFVQPTRPIDVCPANLDAIDVAIYRANKLAKSHRLTLATVSEGLRSAASWCGGDASRLEGRTWFIHADLSDVEPYNRKLLFTVAEFRYGRGGFQFICAGRFNTRVNRMPPVSYVLDVHAVVRPLVFTPI